MMVLISHYALWCSLLYKLVTLSPMHHSRGKYPFIGLSHTWREPKAPAIKIEKLERLRSPVYGDQLCWMLPSAAPGNAYPSFSRQCLSWTIDYRYHTTVRRKDEGRREAAVWDCLLCASVATKPIWFNPKYKVHLTSFFKLKQTEVKWSWPAEPINGVLERFVEYKLLLWFIYWLHKC